MVGFNYQAVANQAFADRQSLYDQLQEQQLLATLGNAVSSYKQQQLPAA